jgi:uncharacterized protein YkwD
LRYLALFLMLTITTLSLAQDFIERDVSPITSIRSDAADGVDYLPIVYDEALSEVANQIAEQILVDETTNTDDIIQMLSDAGYRLTDFGLAWGTTFNDYDNLILELANNYQDMILNETITHFALGYATAPDVNAYIFLAVTFNTCEALDENLDHALQLEQGEALLELLNNERIEADLDPLTLNTDTLYQAARWYADDMLQFGYPTKRKGGIPHIGTDGSTVDERALREGFSASVVRENILSRWTLSAQGAFNQWWNSETHKENMMADDISVMSLAVSCNIVTGEYFYTQVFAEPLAILTPEDLITSLQAQLNVERANAGQLPLNSHIALMTYADELAGYIYENSRFPTSLWDELDNRYPYRTAYAASAATTGDTMETVNYLMDAYADDLLSGDYTEIGIGIYYDDTHNVFWHVLILADPA